MMLDECINNPSFLANRSSIEMAEDLCYAVDAGDCKDAENLLMNGANYNIVLDSGYSALILAIESGNYDICKMMFDLGVDYESLDISCISFAAICRNVDVFDLVFKEIVAKNDKRSAMHTLYLSVKFDDYDICKYILDKIDLYSLRCIHKKENDILNNAVCNDSHNVFRLLLDYGFKFDFSHDKHMSDGYMYCLIKNHRCLEVVLNKEYDVNGFYYNEYTFLHYLFSTYFFVANIDTLKLLLSKGADLHIRYENGKSPMELLKFKADNCKDDVNIYNDYIRFIIEYEGEKLNIEVPVDVKTKTKRRI